MKMPVAKLIDASLQARAAPGRRWTASNTRSPAIPVQGICGPPQTPMSRQSEIEVSALPLKIHVSRSGPNFFNCRSTLAFRDTIMRYRSGQYSDARYRPCI